jgi:hypothetical protein
VTTFEVGQRVEIRKTRRIAYAGRRGIIQKLVRTGQYSLNGKPWPPDKWCVDVLLDSGEIQRFFEFNVRRLNLLELLAEAAME